jgi:hypothetical protein
MFNLQHRRPFFGGAVIRLFIFFIQNGLVPRDEDGG